MNRMKQIRRVISHRPADPGEIPVLMLSQEFDARFCGLSYEQYLSSVDSLVQTQVRCLQEFDYDFAWMHLLLGGIRGVRERFGDDVCVMGRVSAPFSAATFLFGIEEGMVMTMTEPQLLDRAIAFCEGFCIEVARLQVEAGAHALWVGDCNATSHLISPATFRRFALEPARRLLQAIREMGCIAWYYPGDDAPDSLMAFAGACPDMLNLTYGTDLATMRTRLGDRLPLSGNLHPIELLERGSQQAIRAEVERLITAETGKPFVLGSADCVTRETPEGNVRAAIAAARGAA